MAKTICSSAKECPDCVSENITCDEEKEQLVCRDCGLIFEPFVAAKEAKEAAKNVKKKPKKKAKKQ